jgi:hypothetical protein
VSGFVAPPPVFVLVFVAPGTPVVLSRKTSRERRGRLIDAPRLTLRDWLMSAAMLNRPRVE